MSSDEEQETSCPNHFHQQLADRLGIRRHKWVTDLACMLVTSLNHHPLLLYKKETYKLVTGHTYLLETLLLDS
jgi:hypothetical protein